MSRSTLDYPLFSRSSRGSPAQPREAAQQLIPRNCPNSPLSNIRPTNPRLYTSASGSTTSHYLSPNNESLRFRFLLVQISLSFSPVFIYFFFARSINFGSRENRFRSLLHDNVRVFLHLIYWSYIYVDIYIHLTFGESIANRDEHEKISWNLFINIFKRNCFFLLLLLFGIILIKKEKKLNIYICVSLIKL